MQVAEEKLFDLQSAGVPPGQSNEKRICARSAGQPGRFRIEKKPLFRIFESGATTARQFFIACTREKIESYGRRRREFGSREPIANGEMLAEFVAGDAATEEQADGIGFVRKAQRLRLGRSAVEGFRAERRENLSMTEGILRFHAPCEFAGRVELEVCNGPSDEEFTANESPRSKRLRIAKAASLARGTKSPAGPTQEGQPASQGHSG